MKSFELNWHDGYFFSHLICSNVSKATTHISVKHRTVVTVVHAVCVCSLHLCGHLVVVFIIFSSLKCFLLSGLLVLCLLNFVGWCCMIVYDFNVCVCIYVRNPTKMVHLKGSIPLNKLETLLSLQVYCFYQERLL